MGALPGFPLVLGIAIVVALFALRAAARRAITVATLVVHGGVLRVLRGGLAPRIVADLADVVASPPIALLRIQVERDRGRARVTLHGDVSAAQAQRIRNVIGSLPLARLANARTVR